jgi:gamma-glutamylputrescine oxidase
LVNHDSAKTGRRKFLKTATAASASTVATAAALNAVSPSLWKERMDFDSNKSYWAQELAETNPALQQDLEMDVAIIGGGFTGLSAAYYLKQNDPGLRVVVLEARRCGNGASGRNGAMLLTMTEDRYMEWSGDPELDKRLYDLTVDNIERLKSLSAKTGIDAEIEQNGALQVCNTEELAEEGLRFIEKAKRTGFPFEFWDRGKISAAIGTEAYPGGLFDPNSGQIHPGKLVEIFRSAVMNAGVEIYEMTPVVHVEPGEPAYLVTENARRVRAKHVVLATNAFTSKLGLLRRAVCPIFEYVGITAPLSEARLAEIGWRKRIPFNDSRTEVYYLGVTKDNRIHIGGGPTAYVFNNGLNQPAGSEWHFARLREELIHIYPCLANEPFEMTWSGIVDYSLDATPSVGHLGKHHNFYYAIGFSGHGVNLTSVFGRILADLILGQERDWRWLPYLNRLPLYTPNEPFRWLGVQLATEFYRLRDPSTP